MANQIHILNTGEISISPKESYGKEIIEKYFLESEKITIPVLCFLIKSDNGRTVLIDSGVSSKNPMGWLGNLMYNPKPTTEISSHLKAQGIKKIDELFLTHFHTDHVSGLGKLLENIEIKRISADSRGYKYAKKFAGFRWGYCAKMLKGAEIKPIPNCTYENGRYSIARTDENNPVECFNFTGHSHGDLGFLVSQSPGSEKKVMLCGDALEGMLSLKDSTPPKKFQADYSSYIRHIKNLRQMASQGVVMLSSHDANIVHNEKDFFSEEYDKAKEMQAKILEK